MTLKDEVKALKEMVASLSEKLAAVSSVEKIPPKKGFCLPDGIELLSADRLKRESEMLAQQHAQLQVKKANQPIGKGAFSNGH